MRNHRPSRIELTGVCFERQGRRILHDIHWTFRAGEHWAIVGANGSGKTTMLQIAVGYLWPNGGQVSVLGEPFGQVDLRMLRKRIGWVSSALESMIHRDQPAWKIVLSGAFGSTALFDASTPAQRCRARQLLDDLRCGRIAESAYGVLSMGEKQKVLLARALIARPQLLILDEACAGLDIPSREAVLATLERLAGKNRNGRGLSLILVTHHIEEIPPAITHVLVLRGGRVLAAGPKADVLTPAVLGRAFGVRLEIDRRHGRYWPRIRGGR